MTLADCQRIEEMVAALGDQTIRNLVPWIFVFGRLFHDLPESALREEIRFRLVNTLTSVVQHSLYLLPFDNRDIYVVVRDSELVRHWMGTIWAELRWRRRPHQEQPLDWRVVGF